MSIEIKLASLAETAKRVTQTLETEEATKTALILPFLMALDYNVFDPTEVVPEYQADVGVKSHERVDYALLRDGQPTILIEAKQVDVKLDDERHLTQLFRYWNATPAKVGILTNGIEYRFFGDTDQDNLMDAKPFFTVNITRMTPRDVASVSAFSKYNYNLEDTAKLSEELYYQDAIRKVMIGAFKDPQTPFVRWIMTRTYEGVKTASKIAWFKDQVRIALKDFCVANHQTGYQTEEETIASTKRSMEDSAPEPARKSGQLAVEEWTTLENFEPAKGSKPPSLLRLPDGTEREVRTWKSLLIEVAESFVRRGLLTETSCPVFGTLPGKSWINFEPTHPDGNAYPNHHVLSNGLFLYTQVTAKIAVYISEKLFERLGQDSSQVLLKTG